MNFKNFQKKCAQIAAKSEIPLNKKDFNLTFWSLINLKTLLQSDL